MKYVEPLTGSTYPIDRPRWCADDGAYLNLTPGRGLRRSEINADAYSVWRYATAIGVDSSQAVTLGEGWTPLIAGEWCGSRMLFKLEYMMPTGSFKDRGMTVLVSYLKSRGLTHVLEDSSGNAGASLSAYAAAAGIRCRILVPETASYPKIAQIAACGADVLTIRGSRQDVADAAVRMSSDIFYASHNWVPFFVEGTKTLAYELWEQLGFKAPDNVVTPLGYGSNVLGCLRGFDELVRNGEIERMPRIFGVQAANCAPYFEAYRAGADTLIPAGIKPTIAEGIASSKPTRVKEVLQGVRESGGAIVAVSETKIVDALRELARKGLYVEPTSAAGAAGLTQLVESGAIDAPRIDGARADGVRPQSIRTHRRAAAVERAPGMIWLGGSPAATPCTCTSGLRALVACAEGINGMSNAPPPCSSGVLFIRVRAVLRAGCIALALIACGGVHAQAWKPSKPIELVIGTSPGGPQDRMGRAIQRIIQEKKLIDVPVNVVNRPGGGGAIAMTYLNTHAGDAHYVAVNAITTLTNYITGKTSQGPADFTPLAIMGVEYVALFVRADSPMKSGKDLVDRLRKDPASMSFGVGTALGNATHLSFALAMRTAGVDIRKLRTVVFNSGGESMTSLLGGHIDASASAPSAMLSQLRTGKLRILAVGAPKRLPGELSTVPTWSELGINSSFDLWRGIAGPRGLTAAQVAFWDRLLGAVAASAEWKQELEKNDLENIYKNSADTAKHWKSEFDEVKGVLTELGLAK